MTLQQMIAKLPTENLIADILVHQQIIKYQEEYLYRLKQVLKVKNIEFGKRLKDTRKKISTVKRKAQS